MLAESITFLITFVATSGLAAIGILISYQIFQAGKNIINQSLLYQQIFLYSFFLYSIWGNMAIRMIVSGVSTNSELMERLAFILPLPGIPFLMVSWFMLIKSGVHLSGRQVKRIMTYSYFGGFIFILALATYLFSADIINIPTHPDVIIFRLYACSNLIIHIVFLYPFLKSWKDIPVQIDRRKLKNVLLVYSGGTILSSAALFFSGSSGYLITAGALVIMFTVSVCLPIGLKYAIRVPVKHNGRDSDSFEAFCDRYQISKREAEIVQEICSGKSNKAIADKLFISLQTVKDHNHRIFTKTQVKSRVQLANLVREMTGKLNRPIHT